MPDQSVTPSDQHVTAIWNGTVLADSDQTILVEGNHYFPPDAVRREHFRDSSEHSFCPWKGTASYYDVAVGGDVNAGAAWYYPEPMKQAEKIQDYVAFWRGVEVQPAG
jgi:uncharacterized protein (DUF427 family)